MPDPGVPDPQSTLLNPEEKSATAGQLNADRNKARAQMPKGDPLRMPKSLPRNVQQEDTSVGASWQKKYKQRMNETMDKRRAGQTLTPEERAAYGGKLRAERFKSQKQREERKAKSKKGAGQKEYEISNLRFFAFMWIALIQDLIPPILDICLAIGWLVNWIMLPFTWFLYWYLIIRWVEPRSLRRKFWIRSALMSAVGWIPIISDLPEWLGTAFAGWILYKWPSLDKSKAVTDKSAVAKVAVEGKKG